MCKLLSKKIDKLRPKNELISILSWLFFAEAFVSVDRLYVQPYRLWDLVDAVRGSCGTPPLEKLKFLEPRHYFRKSGRMCWCLHYFRCRYYSTLIYIYIYIYCIKRGLKGRNGNCDSGKISLGQWIWVTGTGNHKQINNRTGNGIWKIGKTMGCEIGFGQKFGLRNAILYLPSGSL